MIVWTIAKDAWINRWHIIYDWSGVVCFIGIIVTIICLIIYAKGESSTLLHEVFASTIVITGGCLGLNLLRRKESKLKGQVAIVMRKLKLEL